jgi:hypothetical protein
VNECFFVRAVLNDETKTAIIVPGLAFFLANALASFHVQGDRALVLLKRPGERKYWE